MSFSRSEMDSDSVESQCDPSQEAVYVFEDIVRQASYTNIKPVVTSILTHLDNHQLWDPCDFPLLIFQYFLDSLKVPESDIGQSWTKYLKIFLRYFYAFQFCRIAFYRDRSLNLDNTAITSSFNL
ncbi:unnamed protein product [Trichobilharzia regenti]|nr:unnamed protein product [Trichobilharzia regenti]